MTNTAIDFSFLAGKTLAAVHNEDNERLVFVTDTGEEFALWHSQSCCENVRIESIVGDLADIVGTPILLAEEASNRSDPMGDESWTWTFYKLRTIKGSVDIRWYGSSNGYYSEEVTFSKIKAPAETKSDPARG